MITPIMGGSPVTVGLHSILFYSILLDYQSLYGHEEKTSMAYLDLQVLYIELRPKVRKLP